MSEEILNKIPGIVKSRLSRGSLITLKNKKQLIGVEIGVQWGVNSKWMLDNLDIKKLYLVDPYVPYPAVSGAVSNNDPETKDVAIKLLKKYNNIIWIFEKSNEAVKYIPPEEEFFIVQLLIVG